MALHLERSWHVLAEEVQVTEVAKQAHKCPQSVRHSLDNLRTVRRSRYECQRPVSELVSARDWTGT